MFKLLKLLCYLAICAIIACAGPAAMANSITYTESATGSGSLNGTDFNNALVTLTGIGDTSNVFISNGQYGNTLNSFTINISGVGTATYNDFTSAFVFANPNAQSNGSTITAVGFGVSSGPILAVLDEAFTGYMLDTAIGPITSLGSLGLAAPSVSTDMGTFILDSVPDSNATFTATIPAPTPLPAGFPLLATGLAILAVIHWRKEHGKACAAA